MEMMLALTLGMILLLALYFTLNAHFFNSQVARDVVAESTLGRNILARVSDDIANQLGATDKRGLIDPAAAQQSTTPPTTTTDPAAATDPAASTTPADPAAATPAMPVPVIANSGVYGRTNFLRITNYRLQMPKKLPNGDEDTSEVTNDVRQTCYWLVLSGSDILGLARAEFKQATNSESDLDPTDLPEQEKYIIAKEVKNVTFEFFDGSSRQWVADWDGSGEDESGVATGPPAAIKITLTLKHYIKGIYMPDSGFDGPTYQIVVAVPAANSFPPPPAN
jgi:hypothetical protein